MAAQKLILGAIAGDIIGSVFEWDNIKTTEFPLFVKKSEFTDDSVLTVATMYALDHQKDYAVVYHKFGTYYPLRGYGGGFSKWLASENPAPYNSCGNGSAMRASPVGWYCGSIEAVMNEAKKSAESTHNHPEGIKGAQAAAASVFLARTGKSKEEIKAFIANTFEYDLSRKLDDIRAVYKFDGTCQGTVPEAIIAFLESTDFENAIRLAVSIGGDSDTLACITGGIAEAFYREIPEHITKKIVSILDKELLEIVKEFSAKYRLNSVVQ
jgi:ADP-ribosylglycohydrolase